MDNMAVVVVDAKGLANPADEGEAQQMKLPPASLPNIQQEAADITAAGAAAAVADAQQQQRDVEVFGFVRKLLPDDLVPTTVSSLLLNKCKPQVSEKEKKRLLRLYLYG